LAENNAHLRFVDARKDSLNAKYTAGWCVGNVAVNSDDWSQDQPGKGLFPSTATAEKLTHACSFGSQEFKVFIRKREIDGPAECSDL
jgi:hypothetical protein